MKQLYAIILLLIIILVIYLLTSINTQTVKNSEYFMAFNKNQKQPIHYNDYIIANNFVENNSTTLSNDDTNRTNKKLIASNYADHIYANAYFTSVQDDNNNLAPQAYNIYFND
jgi:hypothetical protein